MRWGFSGRHPSAGEHYTRPSLLVKIKLITGAIVFADALLLAWLAY